MEFQVGDHVLYTGNCCGATNIAGTVVFVDEDTSIGVDFGLNAPRPTHNLNARIPTCTGWWCAPRNLQLLDVPEEVEIPTPNLDLVL